MWVAVVILVVFIVAYLLVVITQAYLEVKDQPRVPMFLCPKHGAVPSKYTLKLNILSEKPIEYCPMCFEDKIKAAKAGK